MDGLNNFKKNEVQLNGESASICEKLEQEMKYRYQSLSEMMENESEGELVENVSQSGRAKRIRNLVAFWLLGLTNNYAYVVMLSAAHDILKSQTSANNSTEEENTTIDMMQCNKQGTAAILLADILPALFIKSISTFLPAVTHLRVFICTMLCASSFLLVSYSVSYAMSFFGVICASLCSGLGEITFIGYAAFFDKDVISTWSSGTGGAGIFGALSYMALTQVGVTPRQSLRIMLFIPVLMAISFWVILVHPNHTSFLRAFKSSPRTTSEQDIVATNVIENKRASKLTLREKRDIIKKVYFKLMLPLALVYMAEYFINQALMEILYFKNIWLTPSEQYRWFQADYQLGVFVSRSSVNLLPIRRTWILTVLQVFNVVLLMFQVFYRFIPSFWIIIVIIFYEGLLGGCSYVNTFYRITKEMPEKEKEFTLAVTTLSDSVGVSIAGAIGMPSHTALCNLHYKTL